MGPRQSGGVTVSVVDSWKKKNRGSGRGCEGRAPVRRGSHDEHRRARFLRELFETSVGLTETPADHSTIADLERYFCQSGRENIYFDLSTHWL